MTDTELYDMDDLERHLGALARSITAEDRQLSAPPADLLAAITEELADDADADLDVVAESPTASARARSDSTPVHRIPDRQTDIPSRTGRAGSGRRPRARLSVTDLSAVRKRRRGLTVWGGLSAAAALAILAVSALYLAALVDDDPGSGTTLASATIANDGLPVAFDRTAEASLVDVNGDLQLDLTFADGDGALPADVDGFYEVWLIDENVEGMISLGVLTADGRVNVPDTVDPAAFPVVDISVEPLDGDPNHSGQSVLRGVLSF